MHPPLHDKLVQETAALRAHVATLSTGNVVRTCAFYLLHGHATETDARLISPPRQVMFLLGLLLATPEPQQPAKFASWRDVRARLNRIFSTYLDMYYVGEKAESEAWRATKEVAAPAFLHYFNQGRLVSPAQDELMFKELLAPFDRDLKQMTGISASETLHAIKAIEARLQLQSRHFFSVRDEEKAARTALLNEAEVRGWPLDEIRRQALARGHDKNLQAVIASIDDIFGAGGPLDRVAGGPLTVGGRGAGAGRPGRESRRCRVNTAMRRR